MTYEPKQATLINDSTPAASPLPADQVSDDPVAQNDGLGLFPSTEAQEALRCLPHDYQLRRDGLHALVQTSKDTYQWIWISSPLVVLGSARAVEGTGWSVLVEFVDPEGNLRRNILPRTKLVVSVKTAMTSLIDRGLRIASDAPARKALVRLFELWQPEANWITVRRSGWVDDAYDSFVCPAGHVVGTRRVSADRPYTMVLCAFSECPQCGLRLQHPGQLLDGSKGPSMTNNTAGHRTVCRIVVNRPSSTLSQLDGENSSAGWQHIQAHGLGDTCWNVPRLLD